MISFQSVKSFSALETTYPSYNLFLFNSWDVCLRKNATGITSKDVFRLDNLWAGSCILTVLFALAAVKPWPPNPPCSEVVGDFGSFMSQCWDQAVCWRPQPCSCPRRCRGSGGCLSQQLSWQGCWREPCSLPGKWLLAAKLADGQGVFCPLCLHWEGVPQFQGWTHHASHSYLPLSPQDLCIH